MRFGNDCISQHSLQRRAIARFSCLEQLLLLGGGVGVGAAVVVAGACHGVVVTVVVVAEVGQHER